MADVESEPPDCQNPKGCSEKGWYGYVEIGGRPTGEKPQRWELCERCWPEAAAKPGWTDAGVY